MTFQNLTCKRCGRAWKPRRIIAPKVCPHCKSPYWNIERGQPKGPRKAVIDPDPAQVEEAVERPLCPICRGNEVILAGRLIRKSGYIQRYICKQCRKTFT